MEINARLNNRSLLIDRTELLFELHDAIKKYSQVALIGYGGSGKTTLVNQYLYNFSDFNQSKVFYFYGQDLELDNDKLDLLRSSLKNKSETLVIIDEFETIQSPKILEQVSLRLKEGRKFNAKTIIISRNYLSSELSNNTYTLSLDNRRLSQKELSNLVTQHLHEKGFNKEILDSFKDVLEGLSASPLAVRMALDIFANEEYSASQIKSIIDQQLNYRNRVIESVSIRNEIFIPDQPKIITDIALVNQSLLAKIVKNPKSIYEITPRQFEELVAEVFEKKGYNVTLTQQTQDGGKDLIILEDKLLGNFLCYVECKRYASDNPVGVRVVRELYGTLMADRATAGVIVTSSYFSEPAYTFTEKIKSQMNLIDYVKLNGIIDSITKSPL